MYHLWSTVPLTQRHQICPKNPLQELFPGQEEAVEDRTKGGVTTGEIKLLSDRFVGVFGCYRDAAQPQEESAEGSSAGGHMKPV